MLDDLREIHGPAHVVYWYHSIHHDLIKSLCPDLVMCSVTTKL